MEMWYISRMSRLILSAAAMAVLVGTGACFSTSDPDPDGDETNGTESATLDSSSTDTQLTHSSGSDDQTQSTETESQNTKSDTTDNSSTSDDSDQSSDDHATTTGTDNSDSDDPSSEDTKDNSTTDSSSETTYDTEDNAPPQIEATSPSHLDVGVKNDAVIRIRFSESMDTNSVENAFSTDVGNVDFEWNGARTEVEIRPKTPLEYAMGEFPDAVPTAKSYSFSVSKQARDLAGNPLNDEYHATFTTFRKISATLSTRDHHDMGGRIYSDGTVYAGQTIFVGDVAAKLGTRGFLSFYIESLAKFVKDDGAVVSAMFRTRTSTVRGTPYSDLGSGIQLRHIEYAKMSAAAYSAAELHDLGIFSSDDTSSEKSSDVTVALVDDIAKGRTWSQYRLQFPTRTDGDTNDDYVSVYGASGITSANLDISVVVP